MRIAQLTFVSLMLAGVAGCAGQTPEHLVPAGALSSAGPSSAGSSNAGSDNLVRDGYTGRFRVTALVLENKQHGPQLCLGAFATSPPQCGGLPLSGWTWNGLNPQSSRGTTWGDYVVTGTFDGRVFTLTESATVSTGKVHPTPRKPDYTSPCAVPTGGWKPVDLAKTTDDAFQAATSMVSADPDFAGLWVDQKKTPPVDHNRGGVIMNDPTKLVLNVRFTKDLARHEADIRKVWGGALCLSQAKHSRAELLKVENQFSPAPGVISSIDDVTGTLEVEKWVATQAQQRELDDKYGPGLVRLIGALEPID